MRYFILTISFFILSFPTFAQWEQKANTIFSKDHGIGFSIGGFGYVLTGGANNQPFSSTKDFFKYDPNTDPHYAVAKATLEKSKTEVRNVPGQGQVQIQTPGYNVEGALNLNQQATPPPAVGSIKSWNGNDYKFKGGDPNNINNWEKI